MKDATQDVKLKLMTLKRTRTFFMPIKDVRITEHMHTSQTYSQNAIMANNGLVNERGKKRTLQHLCESVWISGSGLEDLRHLE